MENATSFRYQINIFNKRDMRQQFLAYWLGKSGPICHLIQNFGCLCRTYFLFILVQRGQILIKIETFPEVVVSNPFIDRYPACPIISHYRLQLALVFFRLLCKSFIPLSSRADCDYCPQFVTKGSCGLFRFVWVL